MLTRRVIGCFVLALISALGLLASVACHLTGWLHIEPPWGKPVYVLHAGILVLGFPLVVFANRTMPKGARGNLEHLFAELPRWVRVATYGLFVYALLNFAYFIFSTGQYPKHGVPFSVKLRGFSGHWMFFYAVEAAGFLALARLGRKRRDNENVA